MTDEQHSVRLHNGNIYVTAELYGTYFGSFESAALLERENAVIIMPLHQAGSGGMLIKKINARGDRVIHAREFLATMNIDEAEDIAAPATWDSHLAGLRVDVERH